MVSTTTSGERPPQPVLGSFHLLLPLVEISFVSVPAGRGQDHLELRKHPAPPSPHPHARNSPAELRLRRRLCPPGRSGLPSGAHLRDGNPALCPSQRTLSPLL